MYGPASNLQTAIAMQEWAARFHRGACEAIERGELATARVFQRKAAEAHDTAVYAMHRRLYVRKRSIS